MVRSSKVSVLSELLNRLGGEASAPYVVIFDLDSTLLSTQERNHVILHQFAEQVGGPPDLFPALEKITPHTMGWNVMDDLRQNGFRHQPTLTRLHAFWLARFFHDDYLQHDPPIPGAVSFVNRVHAEGAIVYYLTGRDEPNMGTGTRASLRRHGFPLDVDRVHLRLKPRFGDDDLAFKMALFPDIRALGTVAAAFENEPRNANLFAAFFPEAQVILLDTTHSPNAPPLAPQIARIKDFRHG
jgi:phosphoglycolate phosphatase-like HAD superfamily hydrolase